MKSAAVAFPMLVLLSIVAILARATALATTGPWFSAPVSLQVYSVSLLVSVIVAITAAVLAAGRATKLDFALHSLDSRSSAAKALVDEDVLLDPVDATDRFSEDDLSAVLDNVEIRRRGLAVGVQEAPAVRERTARLVENPSRRRLEAETKAFAKERAALSSARDLIWPSVFGPICVAVLFAAIAGAMLPGSEVFDVANYQLNTTFILLLSYGMWILVAWLVAAIATLPSGVERRRFRPRLWESSG